MKQNINLILGSGSPRRKELWKQAGLEFDVMVSDAKEIITKEKPEEIVLELAACKADAVAGAFLGWFDEINKGQGKNQKFLIVGADTIVASEGAILGKPKSEEDAVSMLMSLSGKKHSVFTGVKGIFVDEQGSIIEDKGMSFYEETRVEMYPFTREEALAYVATGEPMDKAGSYGIQGTGAVLVKGIEGDYNNVVGFPLSAFVHLGCQKKYFSL